MEKIKPNLRIRLGILGICVLALLFFGFRGNGNVSYYGHSYEAGSVFSPNSYTNYGLFRDMEDELNKLVAQKRNDSLIGVLFSLGIGGITTYSLWKEDEFKDLLIELRNNGRL